MKVYLVYPRYLEDGLLAIFANRDDADEYVEKYEYDNRDKNIDATCSIEEWDVK